MPSDPLHVTSPPGFRTSCPLYLWHHRHYLCEYISTIFNIKHTVQSNTTTICEITTSICVSVWSHTLYRWYNTHCIDDMAPTIFMAQYAMYMTSHPWFMTSQHSMYYISLLYLISNWLYLTTLPLYLCHHTQIINHIIPIVCMITQAQYIWHHMNTYDITSTLYDITKPYDIHTNCIHVTTPRIPVIASTVAGLLLTVYWLYHICNMCDIKPTICMTSYEFYVTSQHLFMISQDCIHDITSTLFMTSHPLNMTLYTLYLWPNSRCNYDKTPTKFLTLYSVYMISHMVNESQHNDCIRHDTERICVIKPTWLMTSHPMYVWNHTHCMHDTIGT